MNSRYFTSDELRLINASPEATIILKNVVDLSGETNMLRATIVIATCAVATSAFAQKAKTAPPRPQYSAALPNTLSMTCSDATRLVLSKPEGVTLRTGTNRWDHYFHDAEYCPTGAADLVPQFVETKDNGSCHVGFTCRSVQD